MSAWDPAPAPTTPTGPPAHGGPSVRGIETLPSSDFVHMRFGRMFRHLPVFDAVDALGELDALAERMISEAEEDKGLDVEDEDQNPDIPAGYTYLGQFIDHDITFDPATSLQRQNDPDAFHDFRTPRLDLDSLYGRGPSDQPYLYDPADPLKLRLGTPVSEDAGRAGPDLPRAPAPGPRALIGDPRNDENLIVSQLHGVFLRFHNAVVAHVRDRGFDGDNAFKEAQRLVRWHYQWVALHDFLRRIAGPEVLHDILRREDYFTGARLEAEDFEGEQQVVHLTRPKLHFYRPREDAYMPVEFSAAAYRFGHSMVRPSYFFNDFVRRQTEPKRTPVFSANHDPANVENLNGFRPLPPDWGFQWKYFFELSEEPHLPQPSYRIDDELVKPLGSLPDREPPDIVSLALRNLRRGVRLGLPSGETVARAMGITPLSEAELDLGTVAPSFVGHAPLWYYVLREAKLRADGRRLGPVGGRIVAEVLVGLVAGDPLSYLSVEPNWQPTLGHGRHFAMADLIRFAGAA